MSFATPKLSCKTNCKTPFFLIVKEDDGISCEDQDISMQRREHFVIIKWINITTTINTITSHGLKGNEMFEDVNITTKGVHVR